MVFCSQSTTYDDCSGLFACGPTLPALYCASRGALKLAPLEARKNTLQSRFPHARDPCASPSEGVLKLILYAGKPLWKRPV